MQHMNTDLLGFFVFSVLHHEVDMAQYGLYGVRICEVQREELDQRVVFNLFPVDVTRKTVGIRSSVGRGVCTGHVIGAHIACARQ